jgi:predicted RNase H-like HicB family nuclease
MKAEREFTVVVHHEDGGVWAEVKDLPGCFASGDTMEELREALDEAIGLYLSDDAQQVTAQAVDPLPIEMEVSRRFLVGA